MTSMLPMRPPRERSLAGLLPDCVNSITAQSPSRFPGAPSAIVIVIDGLGAENLRKRSGHARFLSRHATNESLIAPIPSTTAASLPTLLTASEPGQHGLLGYRTLDAAHDRVVNQLTGWDEWMRPESWQPQQTVFEESERLGVRSSSVGPRKFAGSGLTQAILRGSIYHGVDRLSDRFSEACRIASRRDRELVYLYVPELDKAGHSHGWQSRQWEETLERIDAEVQAAHQSFPELGMVLTADHGMVDVRHEDHIVIPEEDDLWSGIRHVGGEPRFLHLYGDSDRVGSELVNRWRDRFHDAAWVLTRGEALAEEWFGPVEGPHQSRIGDILVAAHDDVAFYDASPESTRARGMVGQHGSLTAQERLIPCIRLGCWA